MADCLSSLHGCAGITGISVEADAKKRRFLAEARNEGARLSKSDSVFFLDDDNVVDSQAVLELMKAFTLDNMIAVASPVIYYKSRPDKVWYGGGWISPLSGILVSKKYASRSLESTSAFHNSSVVRRDVLIRSGGFDEYWHPMYLSEADWFERSGS